MTSKHFADNDGWDDWGDWNDNGNNNNNNNNNMQQHSAVPPPPKSVNNNNELSVSSQPNTNNYNYNNFPGQQSATVQQPTYHHQQQQQHAEYSSYSQFNSYQQPAVQMPTQNQPFHHNREASGRGGINSPPQPAPAPQNRQENSQNVFQSEAMFQQPPQHQSTSQQNPQPFFPQPVAAPLFFDTGNANKNAIFTPPMPVKAPVFEKVKPKPKVESNRPPSIPPPVMSPFEHQRPPSVGQPAQIFDPNRSFEANRPSSNETAFRAPSEGLAAFSQPNQIFDSNRPPSIGQAAFDNQPPIVEKPTKIFDPFGGIPEQPKDENIQQHNDSLPPPPPAAIFENDNREPDFESFQIISNKNSPPPPPPTASNTENLKYPATSVAPNFEFNQMWEPPKTSTPNPPPFNMETPGPLSQPPLVSQRDTFPGAEMPPNDMNLENISAPPAKQEPRRSKYPENKFMMAPMRAPVENKENIQYSAPKPFEKSSTPNMEVYPENRERLEDDSVPLSTDRHSYLVTGQLSQDLVPPVSSSAQQVIARNYPPENNQNEILPPPGLSRMVVGQTESNQSHLNAPPPGLNRMVTGTEVTSNDYNNLRQADGEVSQTPVVPKSTANSFLQNVQEIQQEIQDNSQSFSMTDRNAYLVPGESEVAQQPQQPLSQRGIIPGVESDSSLTNIVTPMQQMKLDRDDDLEEPASERNVNVDGENVCDNVKRDENIEGANTTKQNLIKKPPVNYSTEESERNDESLPRNMRKSKVVPSNDSESERDYKKSRDYKRSNRERSVRDDDDYYGGKRRDKERDRGGKYGRPSDRKRRDDYDSDGSKYEYDTERSKREKDRGRSRNSEDDGSRDGRGDRYRKSKYRNRDERDGEERTRDRNRGNESIRSERSRRDPRDRRDRRDRDDDRDRYTRDSKKYYDSDRDRGRGNRSRYDYESSDRENPRRPRTKDWRDEKKTGAYPAGYGYDHHGGYDQSFNHYYTPEQQQYLQQLFRTNPQAYYEWYNNYCAAFQAQQGRARNVQGGEGSISGYSSGKEGFGSRFLPGGGISRPLNSTSFDQIGYQSMTSEYQLINSQIDLMNQPYRGPASIGPSSIAGDYGDSLARKTPAVDPVEEVEKRSTPHKFISLHSYMNLSNGIITSVDVNDHVFAVKMENIFINDHTRKMFHIYPGPLARGATHKKTMIEFCEEQLKVESVNSMFHTLWHSLDPHMRQANKASYVLLWHYLILLLRQNGNFTEADISELLIKNAEEFENTSEDRSDRQILSKNPSIDNTDASSDEQVVSNTVSTRSTTEEVSALSEKTILHKFRDYLLYGNVKDALDFATDNNLWGHALFLASKVDRRQHANVMLKFANKLPYNDPLQTLYQIMSGRMPACVTNLDDKWGDWRPHLAMIISNCTDKPELVKRSIVALGDLLNNRGDLFGSQFCYLLVDPHFGQYHDSASKIVLLGASHHRSFKEFATNEAIIMTEIYEYARNLHQNQETYFIPELQKYKFLLANNMLDCGMQLKCLLYMEQISLRIIQQPDAFEFDFIQKVCNLADRLKFYDPVMEKSYEDNYNNNALEVIEDQKWLQDLKMVLNETSGRVPFQQPIETVAQPVYAGEYQEDYGQQQPQQIQQEYVQQPVEPVEEPYHPEPVPVYSVPDMGNQMPGAQFGMPNFEQQPNYYAPQFNATQNQEEPQPNQFSYQESPVKAAPEQPPQQQQQPEPMQQQTYGYSWDQPAPTITLPNAMPNKPALQSQGSTEEDSRPNRESEKAKSADLAKKVPQKDGKAENGKGWFGSIFSKFKAPNQMILPDDKNPTIVWDDKNKKWVNKDGDAAEEESFKPPPKMGDMMGKPMMSQQPTMQQMPPQQLQPPQQQMQPSPAHSSMMPNINEMPRNSAPTPTPTSNPGAAPLPTGPPAQNMFKMKKTTLKKSYVDIFSNTGTTIAAKPAPLPETNFFNPQPTQGMPQFYNPNDFQ